MAPHIAVKKFLAELGTQKLWPPLNNVSPFLFCSGWNARNFFEHHFKDQTPLPIIVLIKNVSGTSYLPETKLVRLSSEAFQNYLADADYLEKHACMFYDVQKAIDELYEKLTYSFIDRHDQKTLLSFARQIRDLIWTANGAVWFVIYFEKEFCFQELRESSFPITRQEFNALWDHGTAPLSDSFDIRNQRAILRDLSQSLPLHVIVEQRQYFYTDYHGVKSLHVTQETLKKDYGKYFQPESAKVALVDLEDKKAEKANNFLVWQETLTEKQKTLVRYFQTIIAIRDHRKTLFNKGLTLLWRIAQKIFSDASVSDRLILYCTFDELQKGSTYIKKISSDLAQRKKYGCATFVSYNGDVFVEILHDYEKEKSFLERLFVSQHRQETGISIHEIHGTTGARGTVHGCVRVVLYPQEGDAFRDGEILVTGMTRPEFVPLMKKASAIITDEGGITCHAAIVSRELGKPCIIGTKIATQVLKDGDFVEVDADNGVVRIIKRAAQ